MMVRIVSLSDLLPENVCRKSGTPYWFEAILRMAVGDLDLAHIEVGLICSGDAEVGGVDVDTVGAEVGRKEAFRNNLIE